MNKSMRFFNIVMAFQSFSGQPLRCIDASDSLNEVDIKDVERVLAKLVNHYHNENEKEWPELHRLARTITDKLSNKS